jgi:PucR C-terminal helix-turn-helix domain/GGDEF-like domain
MRQGSANAKALAERLDRRRDEIEEAILVRAYSVSDPAEADDPDYAPGLRAAVATALDYGLDAIASGEERSLPVPPELLAQARLAARNGVSLDTVLRRYFAGFALLGDFLIEEAQAGGLFAGPTLQRMLGGLSAVLDRLVAAVGDEHSRAAGGAGGSTEERLASHVRRLLAGEFLDASELAYDLDGHHLGLLACGPDVEEAIRGLAAALDRRLLSVCAGGEARWGWLGSIREGDPEELRALAAQSLPPRLNLAIGEPGEGIEGWRLTHRQARAALPIATSGPERVVRYADVALIASIARDELLIASMRQLYLAPLSEARDGGRALRRTLRAYFAAERNVSSAAAALGVSRNTVSSRLRAVEQRLGRSLAAVGLEVDAALRLEALGNVHGPRALA